MGDKLGTKIGKRRMSLFGLRPKHTSIIVTIVTGLLVAAATVGVLTFTSQSVRTALFGKDCSLNFMVRSTPLPADKS